MYLIQNVRDLQHLFQGGVFEWIDTGNAVIFLGRFHRYSSVVVLIKDLIEHLNPTLPKYLTILLTATTSTYFLLNRPMTIQNTQNVHRISM